MFSEGSTPIDVAIALNLREKVVSEYYKEYWSLNGMSRLNQIYVEIKDDIWSVVELHRRMKTEGLSPQQASRILKTTIALERQNMMSSFTCRRCGQQISYSKLKPDQRDILSKNRCPYCNDLIT
jgi:DNA-directed RNA polymerase subunit RPC12/RpoP